MFAKGAPNGGSDSPSALVPHFAFPSTHYAPLCVVPRTEYPGGCSSSTEAVVAIIVGNRYGQDTRRWEQSIGITIPPLAQVLYYDLKAKLDIRNDIPRGADSRERCTEVCAVEHKTELGALALRSSVRKTCLANERFTCLAVLGCFLTPASLSAYEQRLRLPALPTIVENASTRKPSH